MKTREKLHHQSPVRKSPRLPSSSSTTIQPIPESRNRPGLNVDPWALSLHVIEPLPLEICHPSQEEVINKSARRSSRSTNNIYRTPIQEIRTIKKPKELAALGLYHLRRSPRFSSSALILRNGNSVEVSEDVGSKKRCRTEVKEASSGRVMKKRKMDSLKLIEGENGNSLLALPEPGSKSLSGRCLRSRTVKMQVENETEMQKSASMKKSGEISRNGRCLRSQGKDCALIELPERHSVGRRSVSANKCLKSKPVKKQIEKEREILEISDSMESAYDVLSDQKCFRTPNSKERELEKCDLGMKSEKCLRSRKIQLNVNVDKSDQEKIILYVENGSKNGESMEKGVKLEKRDKEYKKIICSFVGDPIAEEEARERWGWRYDLKERQRNGRIQKLNEDEEDEIILNVDCHYAQVRIGTLILNIGDCAYVKGEGKKKHIGRILEFFKTVDGEDYFRVQWFFRAEDTVLKDAVSKHDKRRLFYSTLENDNILDCLISKVTIVKITPEQCLKSNPIPSAAFYYDMEYCVEYTTFRTLLKETSTEIRDSFLSNSKHTDGKPDSPKPLAHFPVIESLNSELAMLDLNSGCNGISSVGGELSETAENHEYFLSNSNHTDDKPNSPTPLAQFPIIEPSKPELTVLDLYAGCGGMSTGLCFGAKLSGVNLVTKWAVDFDKSACESLKLNHPETHVRNESAEDFLQLLKQWQKLCKLYVIDLESTFNCEFVEAECNETRLDKEVSSGEYEVSDLLNICYGDPDQRGKHGLHFLVRWKGYGPDGDTWEPIENLGNCKEKIQNFVWKGFKSKFLPQPGDVGVICGGPPCQGISGYNRYRNFDSPLTDERNRQIIVYMDIVEFLKPKYVLMENVVDIIRFDKASIGRYGLSRLVHMKYQTRLGIIASGCYGVAQFRLRVFIWGAHPTEKLPQFPLPTHDVIVKYWPPPAFERNIVAYDEGQSRTLEEAIVLCDSISDLPEVSNNENREEMVYEKPAETGFQKYIRLSKDELMGFASTIDSETKSSVLYDHRPFHMSENDYTRVCQIPHRKGANFRDLPGLIIGENNVARRDPMMEPTKLPNGEFLVPDSVLAFEQGKSKRPFARVWWDETVSTVVTFPNIRAMAILHPEQDRVLTIRECARLQGFPDFYRFSGTVKDRYRQIGNAVSISVSRALGYALGMAYQKVIGDEPLLTLPPNFSSQLT